jgi:hypothetical protein
VTEGQLPEMLTWTFPATGNREFDVLLVVERVLMQLPSDERRRVLAWAVDRFKEEAP